MTFRLAPLTDATDPVALVARLAPHYGTDDAREVLVAIIDILTAERRAPPWGAYVAVRDGLPVGMCAFKTEPQAGAVEIAYGSFPAASGQGIAAAMVGELVAIAERDGNVATVFAHTLPVADASTGVLRHNGFMYLRDVIDPEDGLVWRWARLAHRPE